jgi:DNA-directed RNA polymerase specialized sigma24 family protein
MENTKTYHQLIGPLEDRMIRTIWRIVRDPEDAQDTLQEVLTIIWKRRQRICGHPNPRALILKICIDASYDHLRKHRRHRTEEDPKTLDRVQDQSASHASDTLLGKETEAQIIKAIGRLAKKTGGGGFNAHRAGGILRNHFPGYGMQ